MTDPAGDRAGIGTIERHAGRGVRLTASPNGHFREEELPGFRSRSCLHGQVRPLAGIRRSGGLMIQRTNARLAGFMFLFYIATGIASLVVFNKATSGAEVIAATLASIAQHASLVRVTVVLTLLEAVEAVVLAVALFALTRDVDPDLAVLALAFRAGEGVINAISVARTLGLLSLATSPAATASDAAAANALGALLMKVGVGGSAAFCFAVGSALYAYLFLRARSIPVPLAWLGLLASVLWVVLQ